MLALLVAGLSYWDSHRERVTTDAERRAEARRAAAQRAFLMTAEVQGGGDRLRLEPVHRDEPIQSQMFLFPKSLRSDTVQIAGQARIEADWFAHGLLKARDRAHLREGAGDERVPVGVITTYVADGEARTDQAVYDIGYTVEHRLLGGARVRLQGLSYLSRGGDVQARVDAAWRRRIGEREAAPAAKPAAEGPPD